MPSWNPDQYLKFSDERTRPCRDLVQAIKLSHPQQIIDLGCGPGNSTQVLTERWPDAKITGLDSSEQMIMDARKNYPQINWQQRDIADWKADEGYDLVFSNAAFQWLPDHASLLPHLLQQTKPGGVLAFQVPDNYNAPTQRLIRQLVVSRKWQSYYSEKVRDWRVCDPAVYYDMLSAVVSKIDMWHSESFHIMANSAAIVEWYKGTGLRPFLDVLPQDKCEDFLNDYLQLIKEAYPSQADGKILFPFLRLFVIAYRK